MTFHGNWWCRLQADRGDRHRSDVKDQDFLQSRILCHSPIRVTSPGEDVEQWQRDGRGNGRLDYPVKAVGLAVSMPRKALNLTEMEPVKPVVRLKNLSVY